MSETKNSKFSAAEQALGYLYQVRLALLLSLQRLRREKPFSVELETLDDVVFHDEGEAAKLLQAKHHVRAQANLTDASSDLWKTLRVWCEGYGVGDFSSDNAFILVTTGVAPAGSTASYLGRTDARDIEAAHNRLLATTSSSSSKENAPAYKAFLTLDEDQRKKLLSNVYILDRASRIDDLDQELRQELYHATRPEHLTSFLTRLEGWWYRRAVHHLATSEPGILSNAIVARMEELREQFKRDSLPVDDDIIELEPEEGTYQDRIFVKQLELIGISGRRLFFAIRDYLRAFEQRSRWVREDLLHVGELAKYERKLVEEWELVFERARDALGEDAAEEIKKRTARKIYQWVEEGPDIHIRRNCTEPFVSRGSLQDLADRLEVGWHPEFERILSHLLGQEDVA